MATRGARGTQFARLLSCLVEANQDWAKAAPVLALGVATLDFERNGKPNRVALHDLGLATGNLIAEATARGLSVHQMGGHPSGSRERDLPDPGGVRGGDRDCDRLCGRSRFAPRGNPETRSHSQRAQATAGLRVRRCLARTLLGERLRDRAQPHSGGNNARPHSAHSVAVGEIDSPQAGQSSALISDWPKSSGISGICRSVWAKSI